MHAKLSPSKSSRLLQCPGSVVFDMSTTSKYALLGQSLHEFAKDWFLTGVAPMIEDERHYVMVKDYVEYLKEISNGDTYIEMPIDISEVTGEFGAKGTADAVVVHGNKITVVDFKSGFYRVRAEENTQMMLYALGLLASGYHAHSFDLVIFQPAISSTPDVFTISSDDLRAWHKKVKPVMHRVLEVTRDNVVVEDFVTGDWCKFCSGKTTCKSLVALSLENVFNDVDINNLHVEKMRVREVPQGEELARLFKLVDRIEDFCSAVREAALEAIEAGTLPGFSFARKFGPRKWKDQEKVEYLLRDIDAAYTKKLISPPQAEKLLKDNKDLWEQLQGLIVRTEGTKVVEDETFEVLH